MSAAQTKPSIGHLVEALKETRALTLELVADLNDEQMMGPRLQIVNPLRWEIGHVSWFQEFWVLRHLGGQPPTPYFSQAQLQGAQQLLALSTQKAEERKDKVPTVEQPKTTRVTEAK